MDKCAETINDEACDGCVLKVDTGGDPFCNFSDKACYAITKKRDYCHMSVDEYIDYTKMRRKNYE